MKNVYRKEIDGLRAIAILGVLLFHLNIPGIPGGFLGVDVFFVISGFLITQKISREISLKEFSFIKFYLGRIKRLFPPLFVTILVTFLVGSFILSPEHLSRLGLASIFSILPLSNFLYWTQVGYFDFSNLTKPLLHTWSLGVEEQFYLMWPVLVVILFKVFKKKKSILSVVITLGLISILGSLYFFRIDSSAVFYLVPFRVFEFSVGALGVFLVERVFKKGWWREVAVVLGLLLILIPMFILKTETSVMSVWFGLVVSVGTLLIILAGNVKRVLSNVTSVFIGKISYSLYLVHWPVIVFYQYKNGLISTYREVIFLTIVSFILAFILHRYIEIPCWKGNLLQKRIFGVKNWIVGLIVVYLFILVSGNAWGYGGWHWRYPGDLQEMLENNLKVSKNELYRRGDCMIYEDKDVNHLKDFCYQSKPEEKNILIYGSSQSATLYYGFEKVLGDEWNIYQVTGAGCGKLYSEEERKSDKYCLGLRDKFFDDILVNYKYDLIVVVGRAASFEIPEYQKIFNEMEIDYVFVGQLPEYNIPVHQILSNFGYVEGFGGELIKYMKEEDPKFEDVIRDDNRHYFSQEDVLCNDVTGLCKWREGNHLLYVDGMHLSFVGSEFMAEAFKEWLDDRD